MSDNRPEPGIYEGMPFKDYLDIDAVSNSYLGRLAKCPAAAKVKEPETPALLIGRAIHAFTLEGDDAFNHEFAVAPKIDKRTKAGKIEWAEFVAANFGKSIITTPDFDKVVAISAAVHSHPMAAKLLSSGVTEQTLIWREPNTATFMKCRPDMIPDPDKRVLVDLKSTDNADEDAFIRSVIKYGYARKGATYLDAMNQLRDGKVGANKFDTFIFIAVEKKEPYRTECYQLSGDFIDYGRKEYRRLIDLERKCRKEGYPHYTNAGIKQLEVPRWL